MIKRQELITTKPPITWFCVGISFQMINPKRKGVKEFYKAYHEISARVHDLKYRSTFRLNGGEVLIVASHRVLHARKPFIPNGKRHLQDAYFVYDNAANNIVLLSN